MDYCFFVFFPLKKITNNNLNCKQHVVRQSIASRKDYKDVSLCGSEEQRVELLFLFLCQAEEGDGSICMKQSLQSRK